MSRRKKQVEPAKDLPAVKDAAEKFLQLSFALHPLATQQVIEIVDEMLVSLGRPDAADLWAGRQ